MALRLHSPAFHHGETIPDRHARDGDNLSPPLRWEGAPSGTKSFALIVEDPDAPKGTFRHWGMCGIPGDRSELAEGATLGGARLAVNDFGGKNYDGPQPPLGHGRHHYHFRLAALDVETIDLPDNARVEDIWKAARRHLIEEAELIGTYERP